jgi:acetoacetyl-CoA synthetase
VTPKILFADSDATYKGRQTPLLSKIKSILAQLTRKPKVFIIPVSDNSAATSAFPSMQDFLSLSGRLERLSYEHVPFNYPLVICYSSGTTGPPKCIVHHHGLILNLKKVSVLHNSLGPNDVVMQFSSTSWVLFYIMNGHLATGATTICYDGSPMWPDVRQLIRILAKFKYVLHPIHSHTTPPSHPPLHRATYFGSSPRYLLELQKSSVSPVLEFASLPSLRMVNTTGATLSPAQYRYFYTHFPPRVHLSNSAGSTDTATSVIAADPTSPLHVGEMQTQALGIDVDVADPESGASMRDSGMQGEMIVRKAFPSMPACFWGDTNNKLYRASYFERFANIDVWAQHDWMSFNPETGGSVMHGRSDGVLNPSGIRFGSGEIYAIVEGPAFNASIAETLCVGRRRSADPDETVFLFVRMASGHNFTPSVAEKLRCAISDGLSPRHVPRFIVEVDEIPVTINGKKVETAVKQLISGQEIKVSSTVANPECLRGYKKWAGYEGRKEAKL